MPSFPNDLVSTFVPLFIAIDALGTVPLVLAMTHDFDRSERLKVVNIAMLTALAVGLGFLFVGRGVLRLMGIQVAHFAIAGGLILLILAIRDITTGKLMDVPTKEELIGVVPIGTPLTVGPATITTLLLLSDSYSYTVLLLAFALNLGVAWFAFRQSSAIVRVLGQGGLKAMSKVASLLLAAIAVRMVFQALPQVFPR
ncbi:MAG: MarC family protein [Chloroflexi bacterium]|nr:MarC family protein [Chloroflexota bacterium]